MVIIFKEFVMLRYIANFMTEKEFTMKQDLQANRVVCVRVEVKHS